MKLLKVIPSDKPNKKYVMVMEKFGHKHYFGATGYRDFTLMNDKNSKFYEPDEMEREIVKFRYLKRHQNDKLDEISPGALAYFILWNRPTIKESIKNTENRFNIKIKSS